MSVLTQHASRKAREMGGFAGGIAALAEGKLYALQNQFALDGRVSSYSRDRAGLFGGEQLPAHAERRGDADRHRLRQGRAGDPRTDRISDRAWLAAVAVSAAAERIHVD